MEPLTASTHEEEPGNVAPRGSSMPFASSALRWGCRGAAREEEVAGGSRKKEVAGGGRGLGLRPARSEVARGAGEGCRRKRRVEKR